MKWTKEALILSFQRLQEKIGSRPTMKQFLEDVDTPSNMPIRQQFGNWTGFMEAMGLTPNKPSFSELARKNSIASHKGKRSYAWKGGKITDAHGYIQIWMPEHPNAKMGRGKGYVHEHRLVMSEYLGRPLESYEFVHHRNGVKDDNRIENLELLTKNVHRGIVKCPYCRKEFTIR